jgi:hypothetical protein
MINKNKAISIFSIFAIMFLASCASKTIVVDDNEILTDCRPNWVSKIPKGSFIGIGKSNSETAARSKSRFNAQEEMAQSVATAIVMGTGRSSEQEIAENSDVNIVTADITTAEAKQAISVILRYAQVVETKTCKIENNSIYAVYTLMEYDTKTAKERLKAAEANDRELEMQLNVMQDKNIAIEDILSSVDRVLGN